MLLGRRLLLRERSSTLNGTVPVEGSRLSLSRFGRGSRSRMSQNSSVTSCVWFNAVMLRTLRTRFVIREFEPQPKTGLRLLD